MSAEVKKRRSATTTIDHAASSIELAEKVLDGNRAIIDAEWVEGVNEARAQVGSFTSMQGSVRNINGILELLLRTLDAIDSVDDAAAIDWRAVSGSINFALDQIVSIDSAVSKLKSSEVVVLETGN